MESKRENTESLDKPLDKIGAVTFLDVLGWKGIWQRKDNPINTLDSLREEIQSKATEYSSGRDNIGQTNVLSISDTIVLLTEVTDFNHPTDALELHGQLCSEVLFSSLEQQIPFRGATGFGEFSVNTKNNIFVGKAIDETASWYEQADWIGVFMTPSAFYSYDSKKAKWWISYQPPLKKGLEFSTFVTTWAEIESGEKVVTEITNLFWRMSPIIPEIITKFSHTHRFLNELESRKNKPKEF